MILDFFSCCDTVVFVMAAQNDIMLNGAPYELAEPCSVSRLLELLNMKGKPVVVEHNGAALLPQDFSRVTVSPGDRVEIAPSSPAARVPLSGTVFSNPSSPCHPSTSCLPPLPAKWRQEK